MKLWACERVVERVHCGSRGKWHEETRHFVSPSCELSSQIPGEMTWGLGLQLAK